MVRRGRIKASWSSMVEGRESRREERLMIRSTGIDLDVGKPLVSSDPRMDARS